MIKLIPSDICSAYKDFVIGSKVTNAYVFTSLLKDAIYKHDSTKDTIPGQMYIEIPECIPYVSPGDGKNTNNPDDYILAEHRGKVSAYLRRDRIKDPVTHCAAVVYTYDAYIKDPDVTQEEAEVVKNFTHILVAVLASSGPRSTLSPYRFVHNLAGGNREALVWTADEIRTKAKEILNYHNEWGIVAG